MRPSHFRLTLILGLCLYPAGSLAALKNQSLASKPASQPALQASDKVTAPSSITEITLEREAGAMRLRPEPWYQLILRVDGTATLIVIEGRLRKGTYLAHIPQSAFLKLAQFILDHDFGNYEPFYGEAMSDISAVTTSVVFQGRRKTVVMWGDGKGLSVDTFDAPAELFQIQKNIDAAVANIHWSRVSDDWSYSSADVELGFYFGDWRIPRNASRHQLNSSLIVAVDHQNASMVKALLARGADPNTREESITLHGHPAQPTFPYEEWPVLKIAVEAGNLEIVRLLVQSGADVNANTPNGYTPLLQAAHHASEEAIKHKQPWPLCAEIVKLLLEHGADVNARSKKGETALQAAKGDPIVISILKQAGAKE